MGRTANTVGDRIEDLLGGIPPGRSRDLAEELVRLLVGLYGDGLTHVVDIVRSHDPELVRRLAEDELVGSLLLLHDLHPIDVDTRIQQALDRVRPYLGSHAGGVTYLGVDPDGVARLRLEGHCDGCPSSTMTVSTAIEGALRDAAPELTGVDVEGVVAEPAAPMLQVGMGPPAGWQPPTPARTGDWVVLPETGPPSGRAVSVPVAGTTVAVCAVRGTLYVYRDTCAACGAGLDGSTLEGSVLACAGCGARFDVRLAGAATDGSPAHLDPLPLISDSAGTRVALAEPVPS
ncbi:MAG TPA: NifU family protein [Pseudonocardiaceae bacterium]|nr:NifU family protein [Pseudonocardiaceae bacterium]